MQYKYYLRDLEDPYAKPTEISLKAMEKVRNDTDPPEPYSIKCHADVISADMYNFYSEINYELIAVPVGVPEWDYEEEEEENRFIITAKLDDLNADRRVGLFYYIPEDEQSFLAVHRDAVIASSAPKMYEILKRLYYGARAFLVPEIAKEISKVVDPIEGVINSYDSLYANPVADKKAEEEDMKGDKMDIGSSNICPMCGVPACSPTRSELSADGIHSLDYTCPRCLAEWVSVKSIHSDNNQWRTTVVGPVRCAECGADCKFDKAETEILNAYDSIHRRYYKCTECWYSQVNRRLVTLTNPRTGDLKMSEWEKERLTETKSCDCVECSHKSDADYVPGLAEVVEADQLNEDVEWLRTVPRDTREKLRYIADKYRTRTPVYVDCPECGSHIEPQVELCNAIAPVYKDSDGNSYIGLVDVYYDVTDENAYSISCPRCAYVLAETCKEFDDEYLKRSFLDDGDKLVDLFKLTKEEFLESYSYMSEIEYDKTVAAITEKISCNSTQK